MRPRLARSTRFALFVFVLMPFASSALAASAWDVFSNANALESVAVLEPYVWAPSLSGLHRFDPASGIFTRYFREPGNLSSNHVTRVARDQAGTTWIGTNDAGASLLDTQGVWHRVGTFEGLPSAQVTALEPFQDGVWVGTDQGLAFFVGDELQALWPDGANPSPFLSPVIRDVVSGGGRTWVATNNGVYTTIAGVSWDSVSTNLVPRDVVSLAYQGGVVWAVTSDGSVWSGGETGAWTQAETGLTDSGRRLASGGSLFLGASTGVWRWDESGSTWTAMGGPANASVDVAPDGSPWAGNTQGLWHWNGSTWNNYRSPGPNQNWIYGMTQEGSSVYFACRDDGANAQGGVSRYDDARGWRHFLDGPDPDTCFISPTYIIMAGTDREGYKWFADWDGSIARLDDHGLVPQFTHFFRDTVRYTYGFAFGADPQGFDWIGLDTGCRGCGPGSEPQGLMRIDPDGSRHNFLPTNSAMTSQQIRAISFAPDGTMWVGYADFGVDIFSDRNLQIRVAHLSVAQGLRQNNVWGIQFDGNTAWVLTDGGVARFTATGGAPNFTGFTLTPEMSSLGALNPLALDGQGGAWIASTRGLFRILPGGGTTLYSTANSPLLADDVHSLVRDPATGALWIGTIDGVNRLRPDLLSTGGPVAQPGLLLAPNPIRTGGAFRLVGSDGSIFARSPVEIRDVRGRVLASLRTDAQGNATWNGVDKDGRRVPAGVYFVRVVAYGPGGEPESAAQARMVLLP